MKKHKGCMLSYLNTATQNAAVQRSVYRVENIDAEKIVPNEKNFYSIEGIEEMANSLAVSDHMAPLEVTANGDGTYRLISGERRLSATLCRIRRGEIDKAELPCHVLPAFEAKGALSAAVKSLTHDLSRDRHRLNIISPGYVITEMSENYSRLMGTLETVIARHLFGVGTPQDVSGMVLFLLSERAAWITGEDFVVDGGYLRGAWK